MTPSTPHTSCTSPEHLQSCLPWDSAQEAATAAAGTGLLLVLPPLLPLLPLLVLLLELSPHDF